MFRKFFSYYKPHRKLFLLDLSCATLVGILDEFMPLVVRRIVNSYVPDRNLKAMLAAGAVLLCLYLAKYGLNIIVTWWGHICGVRIQADMRRELFCHLEKMPVTYFDQNKTGNIMSRIINDLQEVSELAHHGPENILMSLVMLAISFVMLLRINVPMTLILFACLPLAVLYVCTIRKKQMDASRDARAKIGEVNASVETSLSGIRVTKAYGGTEEEIGKFDSTNAVYKSARGRFYYYMALFNAGMELFTDIMYLVVIASGGVFLIKGSIDAGDFIAYLLYVSLFTTPIKKLVATYEMLIDGASGFLRFQALMAEPEEQDSPGAVDAGVLKGDIVFHDVTFRYGEKGEKGEDENVIRHLDLSIPSGSTTALVGPSGAGKTTICNLIPRFYEIDAGSITIDGKDIRSFTRESLRRNIGMVAQDVFLFSGSIRDNIAYANPEATDREVEDAAKKADIHDWVMSLPEGYGTQVGERGIMLSGGQRQRISIARVFLKNPRILILDEATSSLDNATEMLIQASLDKLAEGRTVIVVAHRLSTIRGADQIVVLTREGIVEKGTEEELLARGGLYKELYDYQFR